MPLNLLETKKNLRDELRKVSSAELIYLLIKRNGDISRTPCNFLISGEIRV